MKRYSTGALSEERLNQQQKRYEENRKYDYVIIGTGVSALSAGALLANAGFRICMLEAHDVPGGFAHSFEMNGYHFCAQVHYVWGCAPGQRIHQFLEKIGLEDEIEFLSYEPQSYDIASLPDGKKVNIPYGFDQLIENIDEAYPGDRESISRFIEIIEEINREISNFPDKISWWTFLKDGYRFYSLIKYQNKTLQDVFDECELSQPVQAILSANSGDFGSPPNELSIFAYVCLFCGYNEGAYYPKKHYKFFIERIAQFIEDQPGCDIFYETEVTEILQNKGRITHVKTNDGKEFKAENFICNMDPQKTVQMIGQEHFPSKYIKPLSYEYSPAAFNIYLGIKGVDLREHGFGNFNIWHCGQWDTNQMWDEMMKGNYANPLIFLSTPTLHTPELGGAPEGCHVLEITTAANYAIFKELLDKSPKEYRAKKRELSNYLIHEVETKYFPGLSQYIDLKVVGTPTTSQEYVLAPYGNAYGSKMMPSNMGLGRLKADTPFENLLWCNASAGYAGVHGTISTGCNLYKRITGEEVMTKVAPTKDEAIAFAKSKVHQPLSLHT
ncbi:MAG: NAD(P)/FAD-dependent oxidoreductase [Waddliaceae bacterium]